MPLGSAHDNGGSPNRHLQGSEVSTASVSGFPLLFFLLLALVALISRVWAASLLPNAEQDGYSYAEIISRITRHFETGDFRLADLYGFWLPLFQLVTAGLNLFVHDALVSGKIVNVICGAASIVLVFDITRRLTGRVWPALLAFVLLLVDPLHLLYSAACMTDVPHGCLVLGSLWFAMQRRWLLAAIVAACASFIRVESWALIVALPVIQFATERRVSVGPFLILLVPPIAWLGITAAVTGNPLSYFHARTLYHAEYMDFHPGRHGFEWKIISEDLRNFLSGAGKMVSLGAVASGVIVMWQWIRSRTPPATGLMAAVFFYGAMLGLILVAYISKAQPVLLPRYGLTFFATGLPLFCWALVQLVNRTNHHLAKLSLVVAVIVVVAIEAERKLPVLRKVQQDFDAQSRIAAAVVDRLDHTPEARCFSDDVAVRVLSHLPPERFLRTSAARDSGVADTEGFMSYLWAQNATLLVYFPTEDSLPVKFLPQLERSDRSNISSFELVDYAQSTFGPDIWLYRLPDR